MLTVNTDTRMFASPEGIFLVLRLFTKHLKLGWYIYWLVTCFSITGHCFYYWTAEAVIWHLRNYEGSQLAFTLSKGIFHIKTVTPSILINNSNIIRKLPSLFYNLFNNTGVKCVSESRGINFILDIDNLCVFRYIFSWLFMNMHNCLLEESDLLRQYLYKANIRVNPCLNDTVAC